MIYCPEKLKLPTIPFEFAHTNPETGIRFYKFSDLTEELPSVTSVLGATKDSAELTAWKLRVGAEEAARISRVATEKGKALHSLCEAFLKGEEPVLGKSDPILINRFAQVQKVLKERVQETYHIEVPLRSKLLRVAGQTDAISMFDKDLSILDFKTSKHPVERYYIDDYFFQTYAYAQSLQEACGLQKLPKLVIIIASSGSSDAQVFVEDASSPMFHREFVRRRNMFDVLGIENNEV